jgi:hypothetical protein
LVKASKLWQLHGIRLQLQAVFRLLRRLSAKQAGWRKVNVTFLDAEY